MVEEVEHIIPGPVDDEIASWFRVVGASPRQSYDGSLLHRAAVELWKTVKISSAMINGSAAAVHQEVIDALQRMAEHIGLSADDALLIISKAKTDTEGVLFPPKSTFGATRFADIDRPARELEWSVKGVLQRATMSLWYGAPSCGKSFLVTDLGMAIARGVPWMGYKTRKGLVIYQTGEGGVGFRGRLRAYRQHCQIEGDFPFVYLPARINLFSDEKVIDQLIEEIKAWSAFYDMPPEFIAIDTFNAASGGANENANQDVARVFDRCRKLVEIGAHVAVVHHTPASGGRPRGHSSLTGDVETTVAVEETEQIDSETQDDGHIIRRTIRSWSLVKQKDGASHISRSFVLKAITIGKDEDDDDITSCIVDEIMSAVQTAATKQAPKGYFVLHPRNEDIFRSLMTALRKHGTLSPPEAKAPKNAMCVKVQQWHDEMLEAIAGHEEIDEKVKSRVRQRVWRASQQWLKLNLIAKGDAWIWRTTRKVHGIDAPPTGIPVEATAVKNEAKDVGDLVQSS
jgi:hypothetical protein